MDSRSCRPMMVESEDCLEWRMCSGNGFKALQYINIQVMEVSPRSLKPSPSAVKSQSLETLTVVSLPPQLHCLSIWSVKSGQ